MWTQSVQREFTAHVFGVFGEAFPGAAAAAPVGQLIITAAETRAKGSARRAADIIGIRAFPFSCLQNPSVQDCLPPGHHGVPAPLASPQPYEQFGTSRYWLFWLSASGNTGVRPPNEHRTVYRRNGGTWNKQVWPGIRCTISYMKGKQRLRRTALHCAWLFLGVLLIKTSRTDQWSSWCEPG